MNRKIISILLCIFIVLSVSTSFADGAENVELDSSLFTPKKSGSSRKFYYTNDYFLKDGEFYVKDSNDPSWNGAYAFGSDGYWIENQTVEISPDLIRIDGGHWQRSNGKWWYGLDKKGSNDDENNDDDDIETNTNTNKVYNEVGNDNYKKNSKNSVSSLPPGDKVMKVGIVDSVILNHPDYAPYIKKVYNLSLNKEVSLAENEAYLKGVRGINNLSCHGTHCIGDILSSFGGTNIEIYAVEVTSTEGKTLFTDYKNYQWIFSQGIDVLSLSWGYVITAYQRDANDRIIYDSDGYAIKDQNLTNLLRENNKMMRSSVVGSNIYSMGLSQPNVIICNAAGNDNEAIPPYLATDFTLLPNCLVVGATDDITGKKAEFSNYGTDIDVSFNGYTYSTQRNSNYGDMQGTSMATPEVAGLIARLLSRGETKESIMNKLNKNSNYNLWTNSYY